MLFYTKGRLVWKNKFRNKKKLKKNWIVENIIWCDMNNLVDCKVYQLWNEVKESLKNYKCCFKKNRK